MLRKHAEYPAPKQDMPKTHILDMHLSGVKYLTGLHFEIECNMVLAFGMKIHPKWE